MNRAAIDVAPTGRNKLDEYLTTRDLADRYHTAESTIRFWRMKDYGPKGVKVGRRVLYSLAEVERFDRDLAEQSGAA